VLSRDCFEVEEDVTVEMAFWRWCLVFIFGVSLLPCQANTD
jgi:hypothetical protein